MKFRFFAALLLAAVIGALYAFSPSSSNGAGAGGDSQYRLPPR